MTDSAQEPSDHRTKTWAFWKLLRFFWKNSGKLEIPWGNFKKPREFEISPGFSAKLQGNSDFLREISKNLSFLEITQVFLKKLREIGNSLRKFQKTCGIPENSREISKTLGFLGFPGEILKFPGKVWFRETLLIKDRLRNHPALQRRGIIHSKELSSVPGRGFLFARLNRKIGDGGNCASAIFKLCEWVARNRVATSASRGRLGFAPASGSIAVLAGDRDHCGCAATGGIVDAGRGVRRGRGRALGGVLRNRRPLDKPAAGNSLPGFESSRPRFLVCGFPDFRLEADRTASTAS